MSNNKGFTLIELILVISILGILAVSVAPQFVNVQAQANDAQREGVAAAIRDGINMQFARILTTTGVAQFPLVLDPNPDGNCNECFRNVLQDPVASGWTKAGNDYTHTATGVTYQYDSVTGAFNEL